MKLTSSVLFASALAVRSAAGQSLVSASATADASVSSSTPVCGQDYAGSAGTSYEISCGQTYSGNVIDPSSSKQRRTDGLSSKATRDVQSSFEGCIASCDETSTCIAASFVSEQCTLLSSVTDIIETVGAQAAIIATQASSVLPALGSSILSEMQSSATQTVLPPDATTTSQSYQDQLAEHLSQRLSNNAPTITGAGTKIYIDTQATGAATMAKRADVTCVPSKTSVIRAAGTPTPFCKSWIAAKPHTTSPFVSSGILLPAGVDNACSCILADTTYIQTVTSTASTTTTSTVASTSTTTSASVTCIPSKTSVIRAAGSATSFCKSWIATTHASSPFTAIPLPAGVSNACSCILADTAYTSSATSTTSATKAAATTTSSTKAASTTTSSTKAASTTTSSTKAASTTTSSTKATSTTTSSTKATSTTTSSTKATSTTTSSTKASSSTTSSTIAAATGAYVVNTGKRGLCYNDDTVTQQFSRSGQNSQVSWGYNWYLSDTSSNLNPAIEYIPMLYNNDSTLTSQWATAAQQAIDNGATALMSMNEPDWCASGSACMSVASVVKTYKAYMQPFAGKALLGAPAVTNAGSPYGLTYLESFLTECTDCTVDFINLHWYSNKYAGATYFEEYINEARVIADGKPIWITEFGLDSTYSYTDAELQSFLETVMPWMDQQSDIDRYAYFMAAPGILLNSAGTALSGSGAVYNSYTNSTTQPDLA